MIPISIKQAAEILDVNENTVRRYVATEHLPVIAGRGRKGAGNGAQVDLARLPAWEARRQGIQTTLSDPKRNPVRDAIEVFESGALGTVANALAELGAKKLGLSRAQIGQVWSLVALAIVGHRTGRFERNLAEQVGLGDLDDLCSVISLCDIHSEWKSRDVWLPPTIKPFYEAAQRAADAKAERIERK